MDCIKKLILPKVKFRREQYMLHLGLCVTSQLSKLILENVIFLEDVTNFIRLQELQMVILLRQMYMALNPYIVQGGM